MMDSTSQKLGNQLIISCIYDPLSRSFIVGTHIRIFKVALRHGVEIKGVQ